MTKNNKKLSKIQEEQMAKIKSDPVLWAKAYVITYDNAAKKYVPWTARWYQAEMLRDQSRKKVYLCGRRTGKLFCRLSVNYWEDIIRLVRRAN